MTFRLALRNVRRSVRDYALYFLTLTLGVAMFYAFNSVSKQAVLMDAFTSASESMLGLLQYMMLVFSVAVAVVLAFLVVYANRFLLKRRKREFGMYLMLGMSPWRVARILLCETTLVGLGSLVTGLLLGVGISQGLSFVTAWLMGTTMTKYVFVFSPYALLATLACFVAIFLLSALVDVVYISRRRLADLISTHEGSESAVGRNPVLCVLAFLVAVTLLVIAYHELILGGLVVIDQHFVTATVLMVIGTALFFWSLMGFVLFAFSHTKRLRFKGLATFTLRQISSKVNTAFASITVVCIMLFLAVTTLSGGFGMVDVFTSDIKQSTLYDATISTSAALYLGEENGNADLSGEAYAQVYEDWLPEDAAAAAEWGYDAVAYMEQHSEDWDSLVEDAVQLDYYLSGVMYSRLLEPVADQTSADVARLMRSVGGTQVKVVSVEQVNACAALVGQEPLALADGQFIINNTADQTADLAQAMAGLSTMTLGGRTLTASFEVAHLPLRTTSMADVALEIVVPQWVIDELQAQGSIPYQSYVNLMFTCDRASGEDRLTQVLSQVAPIPADQKDSALESDYWCSAWPVFGVYTAQYMAEQSSGLRMIITYLAVYIGFILMLATAAVLAIQQLSEVTDSLPRYRRLSELGASSSAIMRSLRNQTLAYFLVPLSLAACHSACALWVLNGSLFSTLGKSLAGPIAIAAAIVVVIYGIYVLVAYAASRSMVKRALA